MDQKELSINNLIMREIGLEVGAGSRIIDQDTGMAMVFAGRELIAPGAYGGKNCIEFDPYNNKKMMSRLFGYFLQKHSEESDVEVMTYYNVDNGNSGSVQCKMTDNTTITSKPYVKESLKYADIIIRLNGDDNPDLSEYDSDSSSAIRKRSGTRGKNKSNSKTAKNSK